MARFLVVDDSVLARKVLVDLLGGMGHSVVPADSGDKALRILAGGGFDAVLADFNMPGMMGDVLLARIKSISPSTPVVLITSYYDSDRFEAADKRGFFRIVNKPFTNEELVDAIAEIL